MHEVVPDELEVGDPELRAGQARGAALKSRLERRLASVIPAGSRHCTFSPAGALFARVQDTLLDKKVINP